jgi:hypothetical protein
MNALHWQQKQGTNLGVAGVPCIVGLAALRVRNVREGEGAANRCHEQQAARPQAHTGRQDLSEPSSSREVLVWTVNAIEASSCQSL